MNERIKELAKEAGVSDELLNVSFFMPLLERFAALVADAEREACARICDSNVYIKGGIAQQCAEAIRNQGQQTPL